MLSRARMALALAAASSVGAQGALWTFPAMLASAFIIAWGAEVAQFFMSQGLALAILAWLQILPEFAVEASVAWDQNLPNMTANFTGSIRLLVGLGWPMIFATAAFVQWRRKGTLLRVIRVEEEHAVGVVGLLVPILYFIVIWWKASLTIWDGIALILLYGAYLWVVNRVPPKDHEQPEDLAFVPRHVMALRPGVRGATVAAMFVGGGVILLLITHPFVDSLLALAVSMGISQYVFIQWVAPFLSEFPEFLSAFRWAKTVRHAPMALMNVVSANVNQWTVLAGMIPVVYSMSLGHAAGIPFDGMHRHEILLTVVQSLLGLLLLSDLTFTLREAVVIFVLWFVQFVVPGLRPHIVYAYLALTGLVILEMLLGRRRVVVFSAFRRQLKGFPPASPA